MNWRLVNRALAKVEAALNQLLAEHTSLNDNQQSIRERIVSLEAEVRELRAHVRRLDRRDGSDRVH